MHLEGEVVSAGGFAIVTGGTFNLECVGAHGGLGVMTTRIVHAAADLCQPGAAITVPFVRIPPPELVNCAEQNV